MSVNFQLDFRELDRRSDVALRAVAYAAARETTRQISSPQWGWPRTTPRRNGETAGTTRDIVDTGELLASQSEPLSMGVGAYALRWDADYAAAVFLGAVFRKRSGSLPARNAPLAALRAINIEATFKKGW